MNTFKVFSDGGARGNPGPAACAFVVFLNNELIAKSAKYLGETTNNVAEYEGVICALTLMMEKKYLGVVDFYLDSQLVVRQLNGIYKLKAEHLKLFYNRIKSLEKSFYRVNYFYISRTKNKLADQLLNEKLDAVSH